jgi:hypothetical protein
MTDRIAALEAVAKAAKKLENALRTYYEMACPICSGDCASANPPVYMCPSKQAYEAITYFKKSLATLAAAPPDAGDPTAAERARIVAFGQERLRVLNTHEQDGDMIICAAFLDAFLDNIEHGDHDEQEGGK